ncbi:MAG TPA: NUDIX domain-containing protein [Anaerolineales bacterium]|nr:NUDIX domain-containing protein [Anaerolineales bacterium]HNB34784.1 NUDIX domain-containing protein [Anaerolineales bacterium]HNC08295.1 NUDIX domain-containing protein [Anaerolineales bacterium]
MAQLVVKFCPRCGSMVNYEEKFGALRPVCPQCHYIHFQDPKVAAAVLVEEGSRVLLVQRANEPFRGLWTLPAGFVNGGEDPAEAAARECLEETNLTVKITRVYDVISGREHERGADFIIVYCAEIVSGEMKPADDADAVEWFERNALPPLAFKATQKVLLG